MECEIEQYLKWRGEIRSSGMDKKRKNLPTEIGSFIIECIRVFSTKTVVWRDCVGGFNQSWCGGEEM